MYSPASIGNTYNTINPLKTANDKHFVDFELAQGSVEGKIVGNGDTFYSKLKNAVELVNENIIYSDKISEQFITKPNTVDVHDVTIAMQKAQMSLDLTKAVIQRSINSYQTLINMR